MNRLLGIGFEPAGYWRLENERLVFVLEKHSLQKNVLYAFVANAQVLYVGKTTQTLAQRMRGYRAAAATQATNIRNNREIRSLLEKGLAIDILAFPDNGLMHFGQFHLNLAAGLEDSIIRVIVPPWNGGKTERAIDAPHVSPDCETEIEAGPPENMQTGLTFNFSLAQTYFNQGFFNVGVKDQALLGVDGDKIEIFLGTTEEPLVGTINRRANPTGSPRIMGGAGLRDWFQKVANVDARIPVHVLSPTSIKLLAPEG